MSAPLQPSSLALNHPDHPKLADLAPRQPDHTPDTPSPLAQEVTSPQQTATPVSMSDHESNPADSPTSPQPRRPGGLSEGPNARSKSVTVAPDGESTYGALNRHPAPRPVSIANDSSIPSESFRVGVSEDRNRRCRRTMEDAHSFVYDFAAVKGQGYFAVFDGHAGKHAAEWCGQNFHEYLLDALITEPDTPIPDIMNKTFHVVDQRLSHLAQTGRTSSGCTAVTAFLRVEEADNTVHKGFTNPGLQARGLFEGRGEEELEALTSQQPSSRRSSMGGGTSGQTGGASSYGSGPNGMVRKMSSRKIRDFVKGLATRFGEGSAVEDDDNDDEAIITVDGTKVDAIEPQSSKGVRRVLYTANVGDARGVLSRGGKAVRLTYDHKGSDASEAKRITDAGGFVMNNRVNGVLAVTRSLGDASMKEFVVGSPYTTETTLDDTDEFLIVACDGLWDVCSDQEAVDLIQNVQDPQEASRRLLEHAMGNFSTDNLSVLVVKFFH
ncbi:hypothetical protein L202_07286 [Cryptococcus amylolentus CBS 6039]|uniref:PPM-type phosphatase domain-containing protein n=1 Tax=Cryptococcus amylolentus CBS 6039 TaxID=1295533 RepID=A0A1E3HBN6_9TREE|nr:hypothetical protein L202_07286 [Cryptococcus amylolentus CBS 6039]ODN73750.1 hypothetical protein L202_07286 [Cryptococcus amylolentus CBS 6039]